MNFNFKIQAYQTDAVNSVTEVFAGQKVSDDAEDRGRNSEICLPDQALLANIRRIQAERGICLSERLSESPGRCSLDVEMETGTGKTYVYIKTMYELNRKYGWSKFLVVVPSVAIREGVRKSFEMTQAHFMEQYGKKIRFSVYDSRCLSRLEAFAGASGIQVMVINMQAFNTFLKEGGRSREARLIYDKRDEFGSRRPIDVIRACRPILILDEPQKMGGEATRKGLTNFAPLFCLNYSATHKERHDLVYTLNAVDAYNQRLVKRIEVKGFQVKNAGGAGRYLYLENILVSPKHPPKARLEFEAERAGAVRRISRILDVGEDLYSLSGGREAYRGYRVLEIDPLAGQVRFTNGECLSRGDLADGMPEGDRQRLQIRETILSHLEKEEKLFELGVKTLSLFFIDEVARYRRYGENGEELTGEYGRIFEEEYRRAAEGYLAGDETPYRRYLRDIPAEAAHKGYFSVDKRGRAVDGKAGRGGDVSEDISAYELILKNKERLLDLREPVRFLFSHSALREGWDNPNIFQICTLKSGNSTVMKRQEVGRGLRLCVNQEGLRMDAQVLGAERVHQVNRLTVIASESYRAFAADLQKQIQTPGLRLPKDMIRDGNETILLANERNENFEAEEFQALWRLLRHKYVYRAELDSGELIRRAVSRIDRELSVARPEYVMTRSQQRDRIDAEMVRETRSFAEEEVRRLVPEGGGFDSARYDLVGNVAEGASVTRRTAAEILQRITPEIFALFSINPEEFIRKTIGMIREQKALLMAERISYRKTETVYEDSIFEEKRRIGPRRVCQVKKHVLDYVFTDGGTRGELQRKLAEDLERASEVRVYAKIPGDFVIPTPAGDYSPEWLISFCADTGGPAYVAAETRGEADELSAAERVKRVCAEQFFREVSGGGIAYCAGKDYREICRRFGRIGEEKRS